MMNGNNPQRDQWQERIWRGALTPTERTAFKAWLREHPEAGADWELETRLNQALARLPEAPAVSSNFTARVLKAVAAETARENRSRTLGVAGWRRWIPRLAFATVLAAAGLFSVRHLQQAQRAELVQSVATVAEVSSLPSPQILQDFDAIMALSATPAADEQLLTLLE